MLAPRTVLGKQAGPVFPIGVDLDTSFHHHETNLVRTASDDDVSRNLVDYFGILQVAGNAQLVDMSRVLGETTVAQIDPE